MNVDGGALSFKALLDNDQLVEAIEETVRRITGLSDATVAGGKRMDEAFLQTADGIRQAITLIGKACEEHESELARLSSKYDELGRDASAAFNAGRDDEYRAIKEQQSAISGEIAVRKQALAEARELSNALEAEKQKREEATKATTEAAQANQSLRSRIRELKEEMALLIDQGIDEQSDAYKSLVNELGRLQDIQGDIAQQGKILANDEARFQGIIQGLTGLSGGFSAATGAISMFAGENEDLQKVMTKVQSTMAITMGMQQVAQMLNKDSAFQLVTVRKAKELLTVAEMKLATALGISNVAAKALMATLTLGLSVAITAIIAGISHFVGKAKEAKKAQEEFTDAMVEGAYKPIGKIQELSVKYTALGNNIKEKEQFIKDNKKAFDELGVSVAGVRDAENLLIKNKDAFVNAQIAKARALAISRQTAEKVAKQLKLEEEYRSMPDTSSTFVPTSGFGTGYYVTGDNLLKKKKKEEIDALKEEIKKGYERATTEERNGAKTLEEAGINSVRAYTKGTVGAIEQAIAEKQEALKGLVPNSAEWLKANKEIEALQKQLEKPYSKTPGSGSSNQNEALKRKKEEFEKYSSELKSELIEAESVLQKLSVISKKRDEIKDADPDKSKLLASEEKSVLKEIATEYKKAGQEYQDYLDGKLKDAERYINAKKELEEQLKNAGTPSEKEAISTQIKTLDLRFSTSEQEKYDQILQTYRTFEQKKADISAEFDEKIAIARKNKNKDLEDAIAEEKKNALSKMAFEEMQNSPDWEMLFGNLEEVGTKELERLLALIESKTANLGIELSPNDFKVIKDKIKELKNEIKERNPFKALSQGFKELKSATTDGDKMAAIAGMFDGAAKSGSALKGIIGDLTNTLDALGVEGTEEVGHAMQAVEGLANGAQDPIMGVMSGNPVQVVGGAIKAIGSVVQYFAGLNDRRAERSIKEHQENVQNLTSKYKELQWAISKALGESAYRHQQAAIENMRQQQRELQGMINDEEGKKKKDPGKIKEWKEQQKELDRNIADTVDNMRKSLLAGDAKSIADQLGDSLVNAFENGTDAAKAWGNTVQGIMNNLVKNMIIQKVLQDPIKKIIDKHTSKWVDDKGNLKGFGVVTDGIDELSGELQAEFPKLEGAVNALKGKLKFATTETGKSLTGAVKGVTEETASIVAGQLNAMRINQSEATEVLRQQLASLSAIAQNTAYNHYLEDIHREMRAMNMNSKNDSFRSKGIGA